jgi:hypothetical protein
VAKAVVALDVAEAFEYTTGSNLDFMSKKYYFFLIFLFFLIFFLCRCDSDFYYLPGVMLFILSCVSILTLRQPPLLTDLYFFLSQILSALIGPTKLQTACRLLLTQHHDTNNKSTHVGQCPTCSP